MALRSEYQELYGAQKEELMEVLRRLMEEREVSYGARGVTGRALTEERGGAVSDLLRKLGTFRGQLGVSQLGREQQVSDVAGARKYETKMTYAQWAEQKKAATTAFGRQKELIGIRENLARERESRAKKSSRRGMIRNLGTSLVMGGIAGAIMPGAVGVDVAKGGSRLGAFGRGMFAGAPAVASSAAFRWGSQPQGYGGGTPQYSQYPSGQGQAYMEVMGRRSEPFNFWEQLEAQRKRQRGWQGYNRPSPVSYGRGY